MKQEQTIPNDEPKAEGIPWDRCEWICDTCGAATMAPGFEECRGLEARHWTIMYFSDYNYPGKWQTRRYCPKCGPAAVSRLDSTS